MLNSKDRVAIYMESNLDSDYGKMGMGVIRYLSNQITCIIDSNHVGTVSYTHLTLPTKA